MPTRREFLGLGAGAVAAATLPLPTAALAADDSWDVSYLWSISLDNALDYREIVSEILGPELAKDLVVVHGYGDHWGVLLDRTSPDAAAAKAVASKHDALLRERLGGTEVLATALRDRGYERLFHVTYGTLATEEEARVRYDQVAEALGGDVKAGLVIEQAPEGWLVTLRQWVDRDAATALAATHAARLVPLDLPPAAAIVDRNLDVRWSVASGPTASTAPPASAEPAPIPEPPPPPPPATGKITVNKGLPPARAQAEAEARAGGVAELPPAVASPMRDAINAYIQDLRKRKVITPDERTSWYVHSLLDDKTWAAINGDVQLQCASMVKPFIALAFLHRVGEKKLIYGKVSRAKLEAMIQHSDNDAANWAMDAVGGPAAVQRILRSNYGHVLPETTIVEAIPRDGRTYRNRSAARDYVRFSRALWRDELAGSEEIRRLMALPGRDRLITGARAIPSCTRVLNKTGTTSHLCGDFGIVIAKDSKDRDVPYAIVGIVEKSTRAKDFAGWVASRGDVIRGVSNLAYRSLRDVYTLA